MNNKQVAQSWAKQVSSKGKNKTMFFEGSKIYSYGYHFMIAEIIDGEVYMNPDKYSQTTSRHQSIVRSAAISEGFVIRELIG